MRKFGSKETVTLKDIDLIWLIWTAEASYQLCPPFLTLKIRYGGISWWSVWTEGMIAAGKTCLDVHLGTWLLFKNRLEKLWSYPLIFLIWHHHHVMGVQFWVVLTIACEKMAWIFFFSCRVCLELNLFIDVHIFVVVPFKHLKMWASSEVASDFDGVHFLIIYLLDPSTVSYHIIISFLFH